MMKPVLDDLLRPGLKLVVCGTAAGPRSARIGAYYAGPGNKFWDTLHAVGLTPHRIAPEDWRSLDAFGIGFTDMAKAHSGLDRDLPPGAFDAPRLKTVIQEHRPSFLAFNGKTAAKAYFGRKVVDYGRQDETIGHTVVWILPSTSGAASGAWSIQPWQSMAAALAAGS